MGSTLSSCIQHLPPLDDLIHPTPQTYALILTIFQYFPAISLIQWLTSFHPAGKTSLKSSRFNLPGRWAWFLMEIISPLNLIYLLYSLPQKHSLHALPLLNKLLAALFTLHYINRAIISPFFAAPSMSPIHLGIVLSAALFNWFNSGGLAGWLLGYQLDTSPISDGAIPPARVRELKTTVLGTIGTGLFILGMGCNIHSERTLFRLRREEALRRVEKKSDSTTTTKQTPKEKKEGNENIYHKIYTIPPPTGLFRTILYPHYVFEWIEWIGFAVLGTLVTSSYTPIITPGSMGMGMGMGKPELHLAPWLIPAARVTRYLGVGFPVPAVVFVVNAVTNMLPHARWGRRWYVERFGEERVMGRGAVVPFCSWL
ncbi:hypothetical protein BO94DRAFT_583052 [Aspergillus sclerotioniger CBS 115572]|uniref:Uncharacterized protein n=1 Tax=Aspergillus sclerotioniger CBS 115572 TaxID=1450535 RepID=A0A317X514_9EURO|nr:hypothetical protein BO94DRAFT_583052 [Aspergillus sclerotioniger CBS 115572]PWY93679.1 hypothetical protein BO94DRAFT_583052 [Aspergillus sclerotioniger CBS 115572]